LLLFELYLTRLLLTIAAHFLFSGLLFGDASLFGLDLGQLLGLALLDFIGLPFEAAAETDVREAVTERITSVVGLTHVIVGLTELKEHDTVHDLDEKGDSNQ
jgi:hypothetical protein